MVREYVMPAVLPLPLLLKVKVPCTVVPGVALVGACTVVAAS